LSPRGNGGGLQTAPNIFPGFFHFVAPMYDRRSQINQLNLWKSSHPFVIVSERISQQSAQNAGATPARNRPVRWKDLDYNKDRVETFPASVSVNPDTSYSHFPLVKCAVPPHKESKPFAIRVRGDSNKTRYRHKRRHREQ